MKIALRFLCILATGLQPVFAQDSRFILDNSFLIEEAYNQEPGVLQHIFLITADENSMDVEAGFTEELPLSGMNHQLSFTLSGATSDPRNFRINELLFNYRYQLVHTTQISIAPRFSTIIPFSDNRNYSNGWGFQFYLPLSIPCSRLFMVHFNSGIEERWPTGNPRTEEFPLRVETGTIGMSLIVAPSPFCNFLLEGLHTTSLNDPGKNGLSWSVQHTQISPGVRFAMNCKSGLQIVPGFGYPMDLNTGESSFLFYLSFEHRVKK